MSDLPAITGAGGTFEIDGKVYTWSPMTLGRLGAFEAELREVLGSRLDMITPALEICDRANLKGDDRKHALEAAMKEHLRLRQLGPFTLLESLNVPEANALTLKHHLLPNHPDIDTPTLMAMVASKVFGAVAVMILEQARSALPGKGSSPSFAAGSDSLQAA